jgi:predicted permease
MSILDRIFHRDRIYEDLSDEIRAHLDEKTDALVARGMSRADARVEARRAFGNVTGLQEQGRDVWQWPTIESMLLDVRFALRQLRRTPAMATIVILTLALGIAASTTVFSWTRSVLLDPIPGASDGNRLMALESTSASGSWVPTSWLDYIDFRKYLTSFSGLAAAYPRHLAVGDARHSDRRAAELVSANFFDVLGVSPALGHFFPASLDVAEGAQPTAVISWSLWQSQWHGDSTIIGQRVQINGYPFTVAGVAPSSFHGSMPGQRIDIWVPAIMLRQIIPTGGWWLHDRATRTFRVFARLKDGVTPAAARLEVDVFGRRMAEANADVSKGMGAMLLPIWKSHWGMQDGLRAPLLVLLAGCGLLLLIVCANAANLLLARAISRQRELGLRLALGAPQLRLLRQLLTEAGLLALGGAVLGVIASVWMARALVVLVPSFSGAEVSMPAVNAGVLAFAAAIAVSVTLLAGIAPALHGSREAFGESVHGGRGSIGGARATRLRRLLVTGEMALAVVALAGAGLFYQSFRDTRALSPGFDANNVAMASVSLTLAGYDSARGETLLREVTERMATEPGVTAASYADYVPLSFGQGSYEELAVEGYSPPMTENMKLYRAAVGPGYFKVLAVPLREGRDFTAGDDSVHAPVMIVNEAFVRHFLPGRPALGVRVHGWGRWFTIVGVAADTKTYRLSEAPTPFFYVPARQVYRPENGYTFLVRSTMPADQTARRLEQVVHDEDAAIPVVSAMPLATYVAGPLQAQLVATRMLTMLAVVAALLAAIGLYGVVSYTISQRTKEIGVRIALGAQRGDVMRVVVGQFLTLLGGGVVIGILGAVPVRNLLGSILYMKDGTTIGIFVGAAAAMVVVAAVSTLGPARRAMKVDPLEALRAD